MKAFQCLAFSGEAALQVREVQRSALGPHEVRIGVHAAGLNFPDILVTTGKYQIKPDFPFTPGMECTGEVIEVGASVSLVKLGERVVANPGMGCFAEECVIDERRTFTLPDGVAWRTAAVFPITYGTSYHGLSDRGHLRPGEWLLVHGAGGGVGLAAVELGKQMGAKVIATADTHAKRQLAGRHGADITIDSSSADLRKIIRDVTEGRGADVICDPVGGDAFDESLHCIGWGGRLLVVGFTSGRIARAATNMILLKGCSVVGVAAGEFAKREPGRSRTNMTLLLGWLADGKLKPEISASYPFKEIDRAFEAFRGRQTVGRIVVEMR